MTYNMVIAFKDHDNMRYSTAMKRQTPKQCSPLEVI